MWTIYKPEEQKGGHWEQNVLVESGRASRLQKSQMFRRRNVKKSFRNGKQNTYYHPPPQALRCLGYEAKSKTSFYLRGILRKWGTQGQPGSLTARSWRGYQDF